MKKWLGISFVAWSIFLFITWGCGQDSPQKTQDAGTPDKITEKNTLDSHPTQEKHPEKTQEITPPQPLDLSIPLKKGEVRAGIIRDSKEFIKGFNAQELLGDIKIYNSRVAFTIAGKRLTKGYMPYGGKIVAADIVRPKGESGESYFQEFALGFQHRMMKPDKIEIVNDGRNGKPAVVRISGPDAKLDLLQAYIKAVMPNLVADVGPLDIRLTYEYTLAPDSNILDFKIIVKNLTEDYKELQFIEVAFFMGDGISNYFPKKGYVSGNLSGAWDYVGFASPKVGYVVFPKKDQIFQIVAKYKSAILGIHQALELDPKSTHEYLWSIAVGRDLASALASYRSRISKKKEGTVKGTLTEETTDKPLADVPIHIERPLGKNKYEYITRARTKSDGSFEISLPPGQYSLRSYRKETLGPRTEVTLKADETKTINLKAPLMGYLTIETKDADTGTLLPAKITIFRTDKKKPHVPSYYEVDSLAGGASAIIYPHTGKGKILLPVGTYKVIVSRGFFYGLFQKEIKIKGAQTTEVHATLKEEVKIPDGVGGDFHIHAKGSPDSNDSYELKVAAMAAEGLQLAVSTDHEFISDYEPFIKKMKMEKWLRAVIGEEITTFFGHFNAYPIPYRPDKPNNGAFWWYDMDAPQLFELVYKEAPDAVLQINHPRSPSISGYFTFTGYKPELGKPTNKPKKWSNHFDAIEVVNGNGFKFSLKTVFLDWFSILNYGHFVTGMGNSDSHHSRTAECGYPRSIVMLGTNDPQKITMKQLSKAIKAHHVVVSGGAMIRFKASDKGDPSQAVNIGDNLSLTTPTVHLHIKIEAASWIHLNQFKIFANGKLIHTQKLDKDAPNIVRFDKTLTFTPKIDTWYLVMVTGNKGLAPVVPGSVAFAFTNPIFVDVDNDKKFTPPKSFTP